VSNPALYNTLSNIDHSQKKRARLANDLLNNPDLTPGLLDIAFDVEDPVSIKACWVLEFAARDDLNFLLPHADYFVYHLQYLKNDSAIRPMAKICELLMTSYFKNDEVLTEKYLNEDHLEHLCTVCFDWLIGSYQVAIQVFSMSSLYYLGNRFHWIHEELKLVLQQGYENGSAAYKARARHVLTKIA